MVATQVLNIVLDHDFDGLTWEKKSGDIEFLHEVMKIRKVLDDKTKTHQSG